MHHFSDQAVKNNASWCDVITKGHGKDGRIENNL